MHKDEKGPNFEESKDEFLEYILNFKNNISEEKREFMRHEYYNVPLNMAFKLIWQNPHKEDDPMKLEIITKDYRQLELFIKVHY